MNREKPRQLERARVEQKSPPREPWVKRDMTLCIAAPCVHNGRMAIVLCADTQGTDYMAKSFDMYKIRVAQSVNTVFMFCDVVSAANELIAELEPLVIAAFSKPRIDDVVVTQLIADIKTHTREKLRTKRADYIARTYALDVKDFYEVADADMKKAVALLSLDCELLLCHPAKDMTVILHVASWQEGYVAIGSGYRLARGFLSQTNWVPKDLTIMDAAGWLKAAKIAAHQDVYVGHEMTQIMVLIEGERPQQFTADGNNTIDSCMPRTVSKKGVETRAEYLTDAFQLQDEGGA